MKCSFIYLISGHVENDDSMIEWCKIRMNEKNGKDYRQLSKMIFAFSRLVPYISFGFLAESYPNTEEIELRNGICWATIYQNEDKAVR